ncbi:hypothetical protein TNCV_4527881 [Trichonephila clavipes]|nr:hypothetical protein TNCV_4527881 [Trichonephila clavipes]
MRLSYAVGESSVWSDGFDPSSSCLLLGEVAFLWCCANRKYLADDDAGIPILLPDVQSWSQTNYGMSFTGRFVCLSGDCDIPSPPRSLIRDIAVDRYRAKEKLSRSSRVNVRVISPRSVS